MFRFLVAFVTALLLFAPSSLLFSQNPYSYMLDDPAFVGYDLSLKHIEDPYDLHYKVVVPSHVEVDRKTDLIGFKFHYGWINMTRSKTPFVKLNDYLANHENQILLGYNENQKQYSKNKLQYFEGQNKFGEKIVIILTQDNSVYSFTADSRLVHRFRCIS